LNEDIRVDPESRQKERGNIRQILLNNKYSSSSLEKFNRQKRTEQDTQRKKWAKFIYIGKETSFITKIAFTIDNTFEKCLSIRQETPQNKFNRSGIYQLTCPECKLKYT
jgi:hypothetical protein